jgi:hypothetical protein
MAHFSFTSLLKKTSAYEKDGNNKHFSDYGDQIVSDALGAHSLLMSTCVSELRSKSIKSQNKKNISETLGTLSKISLSNKFPATQADLAEARTVIGSMKGKLDNVIATVATLTSKLDNSKTNNPQVILML